MNDDMHPQVSAVLSQAHRLQSLMDDQLHKMSTQTFIATDDTGTVEVSLNGHHRLVSVFIEAGLLRQGAQIVSARLNEALQKAASEASASIDADREQLDAMLNVLTHESRR